MKSEFLQKVSTSLSKTAFKIKKASPELLVIGGAIGVVAAAVGACCATRKIDTILDEHIEDINKIHKAENDEAISYDHKDAQKDITITYAKTAWKLVKLYAPSVILGATSLGCILASNQILRKRNAALVAAYSAVDGAFKRYRKNVVERFGEEVDKQLRFNTKAETIEEKVTDEDGKEKKVKTKANVQQKTNPDLSEYARCFDELNPNFKGNPDLNKTFLTQSMRYFNELLQARGYVFLNEVYEHLGYPHTRAGQVVGWTKHGGDGFVDFGMYDVRKVANRDFMLGYESAIWLDFNVDGPILDHMPD